MSEKTNIFISYSFDKSYDEKEKLVKKLEESSFAVNFSEKDNISHKNDQQIWEYLKKRIYGSSVMIVIYSEDFERNKGGKALGVRDSKLSATHLNPFQRQGWIYKEIRGALREQKNNALNGIIVVMPDHIYDKKFSDGFCSRAGEKRTNLNTNGFPPILAENYGNKKKHLRKPSCGCCFNILEDSFIPIVKMSKFYSNIQFYINLVKGKREHEGDYDITKETG